MKLIDLLKKEMIDGITDVLSGKKKVFKANNITPHMVEEYLESEGWDRGELTNNGWQYDWWLPFTKNEKSFTAHGSGYYGRFEFRKTEDP